MVSLHIVLFFACASALASSSCDVASESNSECALPDVATMLQTGLQANSVKIDAYQASHEVEDLRREIMFLRQENARLKLENKDKFRANSTTDVSLPTQMETDFGPARRHESSNLAIHKQTSAPPSFTILEKIETGDSGTNDLQAEPVDFTGAGAQRHSSLMIPINSTCYPIPRAEGRRAIYLTFDDGPSAFGKTLENAEYLRTQLNATVTYFWLGWPMLDKKVGPEFMNGGLSKVVHEYGHTVGAHSVGHPHMGSLGNHELFKELEETKRLISNATGGYVPLFFRFPYGEAPVSSQHDALLADEYTSYWGWNIDTLDWDTISTPDTAAILRRIDEGWGNGDTSDTLTSHVILMHEGKNPLADTEKLQLKEIVDHIRGKCKDEGTTCVFNGLDACSGAANKQKNGY